MESRVISVLITILLGLITMQFYDCCPKISRWLIMMSAARLRGNAANRYQEEWLAHLDECDEKLWALRHGFGCVVASFSIQFPLYQFTTSVKAYIFVLIVEKLVVLRIDARAKRVVELAKTGATKAMLDSEFDPITEDMAKIVIFKTYRKIIFKKGTPAPDSNALNAAIIPLLSLPKTLFIKS